MTRRDSCSSSSSSKTLVSKLFASRNFAYSTPPAAAARALTSLRECDVMPASTCISYASDPISRLSSRIVHSATMSAAPFSRWLRRGVMAGRLPGRRP